MSAGLGDIKSESEALQAAKNLIAAHRDDCLWFLREDLVPSGRERILELLKMIERRAGRADFIKARKLREWLSRNSSAVS